MTARAALAVALALGILAVSLTAVAQQAAKVYKIGYLASTRPGASEAFRRGLQDLGYVEGRDFVIEYRWADGRPERLPELGADLARIRVDVIVTSGTPATFAAMQATKTIPIVFGSAGAVVEKGIVASLARPGGNVTGLTLQINPLKLYQLLKEAAPKVTRGVYLYDPQSSTADVEESLRSNAQAVNVNWRSVALRDDPNGITQAFAELGRGTDGLVLDLAARIQLKADHICKVALQRRLPTIGYTRGFANAGCLMSYAEDLNDMYRRAAGLVDKILKGARPADLPVEQPTKLELVINLKTARALGLTIPRSLLLRADQIIE